MGSRRIATALGLLGGLAACPRDATPRAATIDSVSGAVTVRAGGIAAAEAAAMGRELDNGDIVSTGADGQATILFASGNRVELRPGASLLIGPRGAQAAEVGAVLLDGGMRATSVKGVRLSIGTPFGLTELADGASIDVDQNKGLAVVIGQISVVSESGERQDVAAGSGLTLAGLVVPLSELKIEGVFALPPGEVVLKPLTVVLLANPKQVQVRRAGSTAWEAPKKREVLQVGDAVRTRKANNTAVQLGDQGTLALGEGSELSLASVEKKDGKQAAVWGLDVGSASLRVENDPGNSEHTLRTKGGELRVTPGAREAVVEVNAGANARTQVLVRSGQVTFPDGTVLEAGTRANLEKGKIAGQVLPLVSTDVAVNPKAAAIVYYQGDIPPVALAWSKGNDAAGYDVEVARDRDFSQLVFKDHLKANRLVLDELGAGKYFWRVKSGESVQRSIISITKGGNAECANCSRINNIDDTGEMTVVYFQQTLPAITLRWKNVNGAASYRVKVFSDGDFDTPLTNQVVKETTHGLRSGELQEGKYYWLVMALDEQEKEIATSPRMNSLEIAYDNAITDITIKNPKHGSKLSTPTVVTTGEVQLGAKLSINGKLADIDEKGRFREALALARGQNRVVYRTTAKDGVERFYVRDVLRR